MEEKDYQCEDQLRLILEDGRELVVWPPSLKEGEKDKEKLVWTEPGHNKFVHRLVSTGEVFRNHPHLKPRIKIVTVAFKKGMKPTKGGVDDGQGGGIS